MARKDHGSSKRDRCDICGTALDDDAVVQEFPDGSVVSLCADCATSSGPEEENGADDVTEADDSTVEWASPRDDNPTAPAPALFEPEIFEAEDFEPADVAAPVQADEPEGAPDATSRVEAELAAWASSGPETRTDSDLDEDYEPDFDQEEAEEATMQLVAAIAEADMVDEALPQPGAVIAAAEAEDAAAAASDSTPEAETAPGSITGPGIPPLPVQGAPAARLEASDKTKEELLVPMADLIALQTEMQSALAKLSSTLEHFVTDVETATIQTDAVNERVKELEDELESTRERLRVAETLLPDAALDAAAAMAAATATSDKDLVAKKEAPAAGAPAKQVAPPSLPPPPPLPPSTAAPVAVPPPLPGLAAAGTGAAAVGAAAAAIVPPPIGGTAAPKAKTPPPPPRPKSAPAATSSTEPETTQVNAPAVTEPESPPAKRETAAPKAPPEDGSDATAVDDSGILAAGPAMPAMPGGPESTSPAAPIPPAPQEAPPAGPVAGAAAAMQKLLRGRKGHQSAESGPEPESQAEPEPAEVPGLTFKINEVQAAQRYFNESEYVKKLSEISKSIGKSKTNVSRTQPGAPEAAVTVFWDIVWYQYIIDLRKELPADTERVTLAQEGMDLQELEPRFTEKNATINDDGRLDASELEVRLLSDPEALIHNLEVSSPEERLAEDATEEIWDQQSAPEFRWD